MQSADTRLDTLLSMLQQDRDQLQKQFDAAALREERLRQENEELKAQLLQALSQLASAPRGVSERQGNRGRAGHGDDEDVIDGKAAVGGLPSPSAPPAAAASQQATNPANASQSDSGASISAAPNAAANPDGWRLELAAAIAAVDEVDILTDNIDFSARARQYAAASSPSTTTTPNLSTSSAAEEPVTRESSEPAVPRGPPPPLVVGADDIFWVNQLHTALVDAGFYPGDDDVDDFYFGESTQSAVMTMQACSGLPETGAVDDATWVALLGPNLELKSSRDLTAEQSESEGGGAAPITGSGKPFAELFSSVREDTAVIGPDGGVRGSASRLEVHDTHIFPDGHVEDDEVVVTENVSTSSDGAVHVTASLRASHAATRTEWPVLLEGDGGREVHALQVALGEAGFSAGEEDIQWWQFGDSTLNAVKTFQACSGLPESGVADVPTWKALLGADAVPGDIDSVRSGHSDDEDLALSAFGERVWLIGEQRWEDKSKMKKV